MKGKKGFQTKAVRLAAASGPSQNPAIVIQQPKTTDKFKVPTFKAMRDKARRGKPVQKTGRANSKRSFARVFGNSVSRPDITKELKARNRNRNGLLASIQQRTQVGVSGTGRTIDSLYQQNQVRHESSYKMPGKGKLTTHPARIKLNNRGLLPPDHRSYLSNGSFPRLHIPNNTAQS
jgi:hypothetical protein